MIGHRNEHQEAGDGRHERADYSRGPRTVLAQPRSGGHVSNRLDHGKYRHGRDRPG